MGNSSSSPRSAERIYDEVKQCIHLLESGGYKDDEVVRYFETLEKYYSFCLDNASLPLINLINRQFHNTHGRSHKRGYLSMSELAARISWLAVLCNEVEKNQPPPHFMKQQLDLMEKEINAIEFVLQVSRPIPYKSIPKLEKRFATLKVKVNSLKEAYSKEVTAESSGLPSPTTEKKAETETKTQKETNPETESKTKPEAKSETKPEAKSETKPEAKPEAKPETKTASSSFGLFAGSSVSSTDSMTEKNVQELASKLIPSLQNLVEKTPHSDLKAAISDILSTLSNASKLGIGTVSSIELLRCTELGIKLSSKSYFDESTQLLVFSNMIGILKMIQVERSQRPPETAPGGLPPPA